MGFRKENNILDSPFNPEGRGIETVKLHVEQEEPDPASDARAVLIYLTTSYVFRNCDDAANRFALKSGSNIYSRLTNSTTEALEKKVAALGGAVALAVASGVIVITYTINNLMFADDHIMSVIRIQGGTINYFGHTMISYGVDYTFVDPTQSDLVGAFEKVIRNNTKAVFVEIIDNPNANLIDIDTLAEMYHSHGVHLVIKDTFATPYLFRPLDHGADIVIESATKFIGGHGTVLGGVIVENGRFD